MANACPKGGDHVWISDEKHGNQFFCRKCRQKKPDEPEAEKEKKSKLPLKAGFLIGLALELIIFGAILYWTSIPQAIEVFLDNYLKYIPGNVLQYATGVVFPAIIALLCFFAILPALMELDFWRIFKNLQRVFLPIDFVLFIAAVLFYGAVNFGIIQPELCTAFSLVTLSQINPQLAQSCVKYQQSQLPSFNKTGTATPLEVSFGYSTGSNSQPYLPSIYKGQIFSLPLSLQDVDTTQDLTGVIIKGYVDNGSCTPGIDCVNMLSTGICSDSNPCTIPAGGQMQITLRSDAPINTSVNTWVTIPMTISYNETASGQGDFYIVRSLNDYKVFTNTITQAQLEPQSRTGPMDTIIYFSPQTYIAGTTPASQTSSQLMFVAIANNGIGIGKIQNIFVDRIGSYNSLNKVQCQIPWSTGSSFTEGTAYDLGSQTIPKSGSIQFSCPITIDDSTASSLLNNGHDSFQHITFTSAAQYTYYETYTYTPDHPVQNGGTGPVAG